MMAKAVKRAAKPVKEKIDEVDFSTTFKKNYYDYGMDVIRDRALPDVRDGLKPVHRAILTEMLTSHMTSKNKTVKVAKITGSVIGKWHPHGDVAVADALSGMAADWRNTMPAIEVKGNNGSIYGDPHAAARYIEARLTPTGDAYGKKLKRGIVPYEPNFDGTLMMPTVLPAQLPYLLINGGEGIAVGVASSIPPHNPIEVINAFISYVKAPKQTTAELMTILKGPDFPSYGEIINKDELPAIYESGLGRVRVRGRIRYDEKNNTLHIYEIPFTSAGYMDRLVDEITVATMETTGKGGKKIAPKILGITDVKNHSGKDGIDIAIKLKKGVDHEAIVKEIFAKTRMETTLKFNFSALNDHRLKQYNLKTYFKDYLAFQHEILINEYIQEKKELSARMEIVRGLLILQTVIDEVVASARNANGKDELREVLMTGKILDGVPKKYHKKISKFRFTELQAENISNLPIYRINKMDYAALIDEGKQIQTDLEYAESIINNATKRKNLIIRRHKDELKKLDPKVFARKTALLNDDVSTVSNLEIPESPLYVGVDKYQYVRIEEKAFDGAVKTTNKSRLGFFDNTGICWNLHLETASLTKNNGTLVNQLLGSEREYVGWSAAISNKDLHYGLFIFEDGNMRITDMRKYMTKTKATKVASGRSDIKLIKVVDVPADAVGVKINGAIFDIEQFSVNGVSGHGRHMMDALDHADVEFITDASAMPATVAKAASSASAANAVGVAYFDGSDTLKFDWSESEPSRESMFAIPYPELLKTTLLFVHNDGKAKRIEGSQFKVSTKRKSIQADKKGCQSIYIGRVPETMVGHYSDGTSKRIETKLISVQGKAGGGVRAFYTQKHELVSVEDGQSSTLPTVSLATQPK